MNRYLPPFMPAILSMSSFRLIGKVCLLPSLVLDSALCHIDNFLQGSFGAAFRVSYTADSESGPIDRTCVIKRVDINRKSFKLVMRESWFLRQLQHPNIARLLHQYHTPPLTYQLLSCIDLTPCQVRVAK